MKKILIIIAIFLPFISFTQDIIKLDSVNYRTYVETIVEGKRVNKDTCSYLFSFRGNVIFTSFKDQKSVFYVKKMWEDDSIYLGHKFKYAECVDNGGFKMVLSLGFDKKSGSHFILLNYNNVKYFYEAKTEGIPTPENELYFYPIEEPDYTDEEVDDFLRQFGDPKIIRKAMAVELWNNEF